MTITFNDRDAIVHGKITEKPLRERPSYPTWAMKLTMAITGLIFGGFVLVHMIGNLKIFLPEHDGKPAIDVYGEFLRTVGEPLFPREGILWIFRIVLLVALVLHVYCAFALVGRAHQSRGKFRRTNLMGGHQSFAARTMIVTGLVPHRRPHPGCCTGSFGQLPPRRRLRQPGCQLQPLARCHLLHPRDAVPVYAPVARHLDRSKRPRYHRQAHPRSDAVHLLPGSGPGNGG